MSEKKKIGRDISPEAFDKMFDEGADISDFVDWQNAKRLAETPKRVNVDFPLWMVEELDLEARRLGVTRQSIIKIWIADQLRRSKTEAGSNLTKPAG